MRKPAFVIFENKGADQLHGNRAADQCLCFPEYITCNPSTFQVLNVDFVNSTINGDGRSILNAYFYGVCIRDHVFYECADLYIFLPLKGKCPACLFYIYPTKKKRNSMIFPLSSPFNPKMLIVIKSLFLIKP